MGDASAVVPPFSVEDLALGEAIGDGKGVEAEFADRIPGIPFRLAEFEFAALAEVDRSAAFVEARLSFDEDESFPRLLFELRFAPVVDEEFLLADDGEAFRWLVFEVRLAPVVEEFLFAKDGEEFRWFVFELRFAPLFEGADCRPVLEAPAELPPATVKTTSRWFALCSTRAVEPGCKRNETTVLSPARCVFTSAKPRPRMASARGTSAAGILT